MVRQSYAQTFEAVSKPRRRGCHFITDYRGQRLLAFAPPKIAIVAKHKLAQTDTRCPFETPIASLAIIPMHCLPQVSADAPSSEIAAHLKKFTAGLKSGVTSSEMSFEHTGKEGMAYEGKDVSGGYFGDFGGRYIPETLVEAHRSVCQFFFFFSSFPFRRVR